MKQWIVLIISSLLLFTLPACAATEVVEPTSTPRVISPEEELAAEERAEEAVATVYAEKTQAASRVSPYIKVSNGKQNLLAFWFLWNDETAFLPLAKFIASDTGLVTCHLESETELTSGTLFSGLELTDDECVTDKVAPANALPAVRIRGYFDNGLQLDCENEAEARDWNVIDLMGESVGNLADVVTIITENDLLGSGDVTLSLYRLDGPDSEPADDALIIPSYVLPAEALQVTFTGEQLADFESAEDVVHALERTFTWNIPAGFSVLDLSPGDENRFVLRVRETQARADQEEEYLRRAYIQIKGVGEPTAP